MVFGVGFFLVSQIIAIFNTDAPFVPIPDEINNQIIEHLHLTNESILYDLGCGDARILKNANDHRPTIHAIGVEKNLFALCLAKFNTRKNKNTKIIFGDIFKTDVHNATHIFVYLFPEVLNVLIPKLKKECAPGTRIVSCDFVCSGVNPSEIIPLSSTGKRGKKLVVYTV